MTREELNDRTFRSFGGAEEIAFICECENERCRSSVLLSPHGFRALREAGEAILHHGHVALADAPAIAERAFVARYEAREGRKLPQG